MWDSAAGRLAGMEDERFGLNGRAESRVGQSPARTQCYKRDQWSQADAFAVGQRQKQPSKECFSRPMLGF